MDLATLCRRISLPEEAIGPVLRRSETPVSEDILRALTIFRLAGRTRGKCPR